MTSSKIGIYIIYKYSVGEDERRGKTLCRRPGWNAPRVGIANPRAESSPSPGSAKQNFICSPRLEAEAAGAIQRTHTTAELYQSERGP